MQEEIFVSGRNIPHIDPSLEIWHWPIGLYLFLGGLAAGIILFASIVVILNKEDEYPTTVKYASLIPPIALVIGLIALIYDLKNPLYSWQLYTTIRIESPMSWGAWVLLVITPMSFLWVFSYFSELFPNWNLKFNWLTNLEKFLKKNRKNMAYALVPFIHYIRSVYWNPFVSIQCKTTMEQCHFRTIIPDFWTINRSRSHHFVSKKC